MASYLTILVFSTFIFITHGAPDSRGTEFLLAFMDNEWTSMRTVNTPLELCVTTFRTSDITVHVTSPAFLRSTGEMQVDSTIVVTAGVVECVTITKLIRPDNVSKNKKAILVQADDEVAVYGINKDTPRSSGAFMAIPVDVLGTKYVTTTGDSWDDRRGQIVLVGVEDGTQVSMEFPGVIKHLAMSFTGTFSPNQTILNVTLNRYDTFQLINSSGDFTGTIIDSDKPIAVLSGNNKANTFKKGSVDHMEEMMIPVKTWGRRFVLNSIPQRKADAIVKIVGYQPNTLIRLNCKKRPYFKTYRLEYAGDYIRVEFVKVCSIFASKAVAVFIINPSMIEPNEFSGPSLIQVPAFEHYHTAYTFKTPLTSLNENYTNYMILFVRKHDIAGLRMNSMPLSITYIAVPFTEFQTSTTAIEPGTHVINHIINNVAFGVIFYGKSGSESYALPGGMRLATSNGECHPMMTSAGDGLDNDCDGAIDEELCDGDNTEDEDNDGLVNEDCATYLSIDGGWSSWRSWGDFCYCVNETSAFILRYRSCDNPEPDFDGLRCPKDGDVDGKPCDDSTCIVDGKWKKWEQWSECSTTCGEGTQHRTRTCGRPAPRNGGRYCRGYAQRSRLCLSIYCSADGGWSNWLEWNPTCYCDDNGDYVQYRHRLCDSPEQKNAGLPCEGSNSESLPCQTGAGTCPVAGGWTMWTEYEECLQQCDQFNQTRYRTCANPSPQNGGAECRGKGQETQDCIEVLYCPINGAWSEWELWETACHCMEGTNAEQYRYRTCDNPVPQYDGADCPGGVNDTRSCDGNCPVDGEWRLWSQWSGCSVTCGGGMQSRNRTCNNPPPQNGGRNCLGSREQPRVCLTGMLCITDGGWSSWQNWDPTCYCQEGGDYLQYRYRLCDSPEPKNGGQMCAGIVSESQPCQTAAGACPIAGGWTTWGEYEECLKQCDQYNQTRYRTCTNPSPQNGGADCLEKGQETQDCIEILYCPIDGAWSEWEQWEQACHCMEGTNAEQYRYRTCDNPVPQYDGADCPGGVNDTRSCDGNCPVDGRWRKWAEWSSCSATCGEGMTSRDRSCNNPPPQNGGRSCGFRREESRVCLTGMLCIVDGGWSQWQAWDPTCYCDDNGDFVQYRYRLCDNPETKNGGQQCEGSDSESTSCQTGAGTCPVAGGWTTWTEYEECLQQCDQYNQTRYRTCTNPSPQNEGADCLGKDQETQDCIEVLYCPIDGGWTEWEEWETACHCVEGTKAEQYRYRICDNPEPVYDGAECPGDEMDTRSCVGNCPIDGGWSDWSRWGDCSVTCETGIYARGRFCRNPEPQNGGVTCRGKAVQEAACVTGVYCPVPPIPTWEDWQSWRPCSDTCTQTRIRYCAQFHCEGPSQQVYPCYMGECEDFEHFEWIWADWKGDESPFDGIQGLAPSVIVLIVCAVLVLQVAPFLLP